MNHITDFPIFKTQPGFGSYPLIYLDSAATTQKPQVVIDAEAQFYANDYANVHRGVYALSERATRAYESTRHVVQQFIHAKQAHEIIFTSGTTESINLVAHSFGFLQLKSGDEILMSHMEHHSNIVPWQMACERVGATLKIIPVLDDGSLDLVSYQKALNARTKLVSIIHVSNVLGTINPVKSMIEMAHQHNVPVLVDGAQAIAHMPVDVQDLDCDFYAFSAHKMYGPTGVGVLYGKEKWLTQMPPYQTGGDMISRVTVEKTEFNVLPYKFEAGTPNIAGVVALAAAVRYIESIGFDAIQSHELQLLHAATQLLASIPQLKIYGCANHKVGVISFSLDHIHPHDVATIVDQYGIAIRAGHHCAMPLIERFGVPALSRVSFGIYNQLSDIDAFIQALKKVIQLFHR